MPTPPAVRRGGYERDRGAHTVKRLTTAIAAAGLAGAIAVTGWTGWSAVATALDAHRSTTTTGASDDDSGSSSSSNSVSGGAPVTAGSGTVHAGSSGS